MTRSEPRRSLGLGGGGGKGGAGGKGGGGGGRRGGGSGRHGRDQNDVVVRRGRRGRVRQRRATPPTISGSRQGGFCYLWGQYVANGDQEVAEEWPDRHPSL